jgi:hypothetical protein
MNHLFGLPKVQTTALPSLGMGLKILSLGGRGKVLIILKVAQTFFHTQHSFYTLQCCCSKCIILAKYSELSVSVFQLEITKFDEEFVTFYVSRFYHSQHTKIFSHFKLGYSYMYHYSVFIL